MRPAEAAPEDRLILAEALEIRLSGCIALH